MAKKKVHPRWEEDGESISIVVSEPSKEEVEKLKTESVRLILNFSTSSLEGSLTTIDIDSP